MHYSAVRVSVRSLSCGAIGSVPSFTFFVHKGSTERPWEGPGLQSLGAAGSCCALLSTYRVRRSGTLGWTMERNGALILWLVWGQRCECVPLVQLSVGGSSAGPRAYEVREPRASAVSARCSLQIRSWHVASYLGIFQKFYSKCLQTWWWIITKQPISK